MVFRQYSRQSAMARQRYRVVNAVPALRDKELVSAFRYGQLFNQHLRRTLPGMAPLEGTRFSSGDVSTNNYFLRTLMRDDNPPTEEDLRNALDDVRRLPGVLNDGRVAGALDKAKIQAAVEAVIMGQVLQAGPGSTAPASAVSVQKRGAQGGATGQEGAQTGPPPRAEPEERRGRRHRRAVRRIQGRGMGARAPPR